MPSRPTKKSDPKPVIYANNAGTSWPKPPVVAEAVARCLAATPAAVADGFGRDHGALARHLGVDGTERLLVTSGCTSALGLAISDLPWGEGEVVITSSLEHHALARPVDKLDRERGVIVKRSPYQPGVPFDLDWCEAELRRGRVRLVAVTGASNVTGERLPLEAIVAVAHQHGAEVLIDAAQLVGITPFDASSLGADIVTFAGHKGPLGPHGIGGVWATDEVVFESPWAVCEIPEDDAPLESRPRCSAFPSWCDVGSVNMAGLAGLVAGMDWLRDRVRQGVESEIGANPRGLAQAFRSAIAKIEGVSILGRPGADATATTALKIEALPLEITEQWFSQRGAIVRAGSHCAPWALEALESPGGVLRVSFGPFNTEAEVDRLVALVSAAARG
jgi:selenocysteine lyase/cysteine desulfurase